MKCYRCNLKLTLCRKLANNFAPAKPKLLRHNSHHPKGRHFRRHIQSKKWLHLKLLPLLKGNFQRLDPCRRENSLRDKAQHHQPHLLGLFQRPRRHLELEQRRERGSVLWKGKVWFACLIITPYGEILEGK